MLAYLNIFKKSKRNKCSLISTSKIRLISNIYSTNTAEFSLVPCNVYPSPCSYSLASMNAYTLIHILHTKLQLYI